MSTLRRSAWIRWLPPIESASPSPVTRPRGRGAPWRGPVAIAGARPWIEWIVGLHVVREPPRSRCPTRTRGSRGGCRAPGGTTGHPRGSRSRRSGAPAHLLVGLEVLRRQLNEAVAVLHAASAIAVIASSSSAAVSGRPRTVYETASTRNSAEEQRQLAEVHLGNEHLRIAAEHVARVRGERVEVVEVRMRDADPASVRRTAATIGP